MFMRYVGNFSLTNYITKLKYKEVIFPFQTQHKKLIGSYLNLNPNSWVLTTLISLNCDKIIVKKYFELAREIYIKKKVDVEKNPLGKWV